MLERDYASLDLLLLPAPLLLFCRHHLSVSALVTASVSREDVQLASALGAAAEDELVAQQVQFCDRQPVGVLDLLCVGLQLVRTGYEERNIRAEFPEYDEYAARTKRLVPFLF